MIVLASGSPRRAELLAQIGIEFQVCPANIDETVHAGEAAKEYVARLALEKARHVLNTQVEHELVLAADTSVVLNGQILGKPVDHSDWHNMMAALSGQTHEVMTGVAVSSEDRDQVIVVTSQVTFTDLSPSRISAYLSTDEGLDKAGGYGIQGIGAVLVKHISGSYSNIVGLPLTETAELLEGFGYPVLGNSTGLSGS